MIQLGFKGLSGTWMGAPVITHLCEFGLSANSAKCELNTRYKNGQSWWPQSCWCREVFPYMPGCHIYDEALPPACPQHISSSFVKRALAARGMQKFLIMVRNEHGCRWGVLSIPQKKRWKELNRELNKPMPEVCLIPVFRLREINRRRKLTVCLEWSLSLPDPSRLMNNEWAGQKQLPFGDTSWWMITGSTGSVFA